MGRCTIERNLIIRTAVNFYYILSSGIKRKEIMSAKIKAE